MMLVVFDVGAALFAPAIAFAINATWFQAETIQSRGPPSPPLSCAKRLGARFLAIDASSSSMDQHRNLAMREDLDRFAAEDNRRDAVAAVRGHDD